MENLLQGLSAVFVSALVGLFISFPLPGCLTVRQLASDSISGVHVPSALESFSGRKLTLAFSVKVSSPPIQHTLSHKDCPACESARSSVISAQLSPDMRFRGAAESWLLSRQFTGSVRARYVAPRTIKDYEEYLHVLVRFFGDVPLHEIHVGHIRQYQHDRATGKLGTPHDELFERVCKWMKISPKQARANPMLAAVVDARANTICKDEIGPNKINQEVGVLVRILKRAGVWTAELEEFYEPLQHEESDIPKALTPAEQAKWLDVAGSEERWSVIYWYSIVAFRTTASNVEMRSLRLGDANLAGQTISVQSATAKNKYRIRTIALAPDAVWALEKLIYRAREVGSTLPHEYIFPFKNHRGEWVPEKPMTVSGIKKPWNEVRNASGLLNFTPHDTRHTAITRMAEAGTPIPVIMSMAGHMSLKMMQHYTQVSQQAQRWAVDAVYQQKFYPTPGQKKFGKGAFSA